MASLTFKQRYPWTINPPVANAAMAGFAGANLAVAVSKAGGIGFIGATPDMAELERQFILAKELLGSTTLQAKDTLYLPIAVGFLTFLTDIDAAAEIVARHHPAAIWISCAPKVGDYEAWTSKMRAASPKSEIWIQLASVAVAVQVATTCSPEVIIMQGSDAGGHGPSPGAGIISLVPETLDALDAAGFSHIDIFAAGGIMGGRGVAAALVAGAQGVVMGTRFVASEEIEVPVPEYQEAILRARDGGISTVRATVFDELKGVNIWPTGYDGRAIAGPSYTDYRDGVELEEVRRRYADMAGQSHKGFGEEGRAAIWAGSGVGLVTKVKSAGDIVREVRGGAKIYLESAVLLFD